MNMLVWLLFQIVFAWNNQGNNMCLFEDLSVGTCYPDDCYNIYWGGPDNEAPHIEQDCTI